MHDHATICSAFSARSAAGHNWITARFTGEFDATTEPAASALVARLMDENPAARTLTLDLSQVRFVDSAGLRLITGVYARCLLGDVAVELRPSGCVQRLLAFADADTMLGMLDGEIEPASLLV